MKKKLVLTLMALILWPTARMVAQEQQKEPQFKLVKFYLALLRKGPGWTTAPGDASTQLHQKHLAYARGLLAEGKAIIAGPLSDNQDLRGVYIFRAATLEEANAWAAADPVIAAGHLTVEMHPWWSEDVFRKAAPTTKMETAYLALLSRGSKWTPGQTPASQELQKAHLANINRLAQMKKLVVAVPFGDDTSLRGIFVFRVASLAEAQELADTDPAVKAGRLAIDLHPWQVPEGILP